MSLNLHDIVRGPINAVNSDTPGTVYVSTGSTMNRGIATPTFTSVTAQLQIQAQDHSRLLHERGLLYTENRLVIYAYGNLQDVERPDQTGAAVIQDTSTSNWYAVTQVLEWWPGWCCVQVTRQLNAANIAALLAQVQNGANPP